MEKLEKPLALQLNWWVWLGLGSVAAINEFDEGRYGTGCIGLASVAFGLYLLWARLHLKKSRPSEPR
tara:strand:- start:196 stop:396 length:201 start_codon:yes stop_codon:yes gene_type:complete